MGTYEAQKVLTRAIRHLVRTSTGDEATLTAVAMIDLARQKVQWEEAHR